MTTSRTNAPNVPVSTARRSTNVLSYGCDLAKEHLPLCILLLIALFPIFGQLGDDYLWADEGDTAVLARSILQFGVPKAWDGVTFTDSDMGTRENKDLVMVSHPWLQYYATAASFALFGENTFAARLPFAVAAYVTILIVYLLIMRAGGDRKAALCASLLLLLSVQFLLFARQCRNYSMSMFLICLLLLIFFELRNLRSAILFSVTAILAFHSHPASIAPIGGLAALTLFYKPLKPLRRWIWLSMPVIVACTAPWFLIARTGYNENTTLLKDWTLLLPRLLQFFIECGSVTPVVAVIALAVYLWIKTWRTERVPWRSVSFHMFEGRERDVVVVIFTLLACYGFLAALTQGRADLWVAGLRHTTAVIPFTFILVGILIARVSGRSTIAFLVLVALLSVTKLGRLTPLSFSHEAKVTFDPNDIASMHVPKSWQDRFLRTSLPAFSRDLLRSNHGSVAQICRFLKTNAAPGEVLITNYEWEPLYFHTKLPQGLKVLPSYPIHQRVKELGLPTYVYSVKDVRWIVWRWTWGDYRNYEWPLIAAALNYNHATLTPVASIRETAWENRPNIHFHRFPGDDYKFPFYDKLQDITIFRVTYPSDKKQSGETVARN